MYEITRNLRGHCWSVSAPLGTMFWISLKFAQFSMSVPDKLMHTRNLLHITGEETSQAVLWLHGFSCEAFIVKGI